MKSLFVVPLLVCFCTAADFQYQRIGCADDVSEYVITVDIPRDCGPGRDGTKWKAFVDCVTSAGADMRKAVKHCQEGDHAHSGEQDAFYPDVCPDTPSQNQFKYHCCIENHALGFSTNMTWKMYKDKQAECAKTVYGS